MKSLLEIDPKKLVIITFIFVLVILPITLIFFGININNWWMPFIAGLGLMIFFMLIYPRITKNKEFLKEAKESKKATELSRKRPDIYKIRIVALITLVVLALLDTYFIFKKQIDYASFVTVSAIFTFMIYYSKWLQKDKKTSAYGKKLQNLEEKNMAFISKIRSWGLIICMIILIIWIITFYFYFFRK
jgi:hypothetical protein